MKSIYLIGMPACGKTTIGRKLAMLLKAGWKDADQEFEKFHGRTIKDMIINDGIPFFRDLEEEWMVNHCPTGCVVSMGGGVIEREKSREVLKKGIVVYLWASNETLISRLRHREHLKHTKDWNQFLSDKYRVRRRLYEDTANLIVNADDEDVAVVIAGALQQEKIKALWSSLA